MLKVAFKCFENCGLLTTKRIECLRRTILK